jgi:flagellar motor switch protein FliM
MSEAVSNKLSKERIRQLLAVVGRNPEKQDTQVEAAEYDWHQCRYFSSDQLEKLDDFAKKVALAVAEKFTLVYQVGFEVTVTSISQHFADTFLAQNSDTVKNDYHLAFGTDEDHACGLITIPLKTASVWATQLLGDHEPQEDASKNLTKLEESLLSDAASDLLEAFSECDNSFEFRPADGVVRGWLPIELEGTAEICEVVLNIKRANSEDATEAHVLLLCDRLEPVIGKRTAGTYSYSADDVSKAILGHLEQMHVSVEAQLGHAMLTFEELMCLQVEDTLLLDKRIDEPVRLIVEGIELFQGQMAKSAGRYAVAITGSSSEP